jgi:hypothetical protein
MTCAGIQHGERTFLDMKLRGAHPDFRAAADNGKNLVIIMYMIPTITDVNQYDVDMLNFFVGYRFVFRAQG